MAHVGWTMGDDTIEVYVTKYALTTGVFRSRGKASQEGGYVGTYCAGMSCSRREWARTHAEALAQVKAARSPAPAHHAVAPPSLLNIENGLVQGELPMLAVPMAKEWT